MADGSRSGTLVAPGEAALRDRVRAARRLVVLTGAGMSAECGVPVFRGSGGLWEGYRPEELATPEAFARDPERVWRWYRWRHERVAAAEPHAGYAALTRLQREGGYRSFTIVTQNVDGMHARSGQRGVVELHGTMIRARCTRHCGATASTGDVDPRNPACSGCGTGKLRPAVVWFGESLPGEALDAAGDALEACDQVWVVGTSSVVYPAAALPRLAAERGVTVIEINPETTPLTAHATAHRPAAASAGLVELAAWRLSP